MTEDRWVEGLTTGEPIELIEDTVVGKTTVGILGITEGLLTRSAATLRAVPEVKVGELFLSKHEPPPVLLGDHVKPKQVGVTSQRAKHCVKSPLGKT